MYTRFLTFLMIAFCAACSTPPPAEQTEEAVTNGAPTGNLVDLAAHGVPLVAVVPDSATTGAVAQVRWNDDLGQVEIRAGEGFAVVVVEEEGDMARLKADLDRDMLQEHTVVQETPALLVYKSAFPDSAGTFVHFYQVLQAGGRTFVVRDMPPGQYNEREVRAMATSISSKPAA
jgi:hypothetical protein